MPKKIKLISVLAIMFMLISCTNLPIVTEKKELGNKKPFADVLIPQEMTVTNSNIKKQDNTTVGRVVAKGYVKVESVLNFYQTTMKQYNWQLDNKFKDKNKTLLVFSKGKRSAAITITEDWLNTIVDINVKN